MSPHATKAFQTGRDVRLLARNTTDCPITSGLAPGYLQANLIVLPSRYAADFRLFCARNPVPCPLLAESQSPGRWDAFRSYLPGTKAPSALLSDVDVRTDVPCYNVYVDSVAAKTGCPDILAEWTDDHVAFLIGCSFSFESALVAAGLPLLHTALGRNVAVYRTALPLFPAGVFDGGNVIVSLRAFPLRDIDEVRAITRPYSATHGEPIAWGWDALQRLGIQDVDKPQWGDAPLTEDGRPLGDTMGSDDLVPVLWGCGVTPQEAVMKASLEGTVMAHTPGYMLVLDCLDSDVVVA